MVNEKREGRKKYSGSVGQSRSEVRVNVMFSVWDADPPSNLKSERHVREVISEVIPPFDKHF